VKCLIINQPDAPVSQIYFGKKLHVSVSSSVHRQETFPVKQSMVYIIQVFLTAFKQDQDPACKLSENVYNIHHCCVYSEKLLMMNRGTV
jgi:hypothetical protein